jgi:hypothetical protein
MRLISEILPDGWGLVSFNRPRPAHFRPSFQVAISLVFSCKPHDNDTIGDQIRTFDAI